MVKVKERSFHSSLQAFLEGFLALWYPTLCLACTRHLPIQSGPICIYCLHKLPLTQHWLEDDNAFVQRFWGRLHLESAAALLLYHKGGIAQPLLRQLKYHGKKQAGIYLGQYLGSRLRSAPLFSGVQLILPVPLHWKKLRERGYNQSDLFAQGLSEEMKVPWKKDVLLRTKATGSQTRKSRIDRMLNVQDSFRVARPEIIRGKHVLLVDDVMTTGATLEACAQKILLVEGVKISFATIAMANQ